MKTLFFVGLIFFFGCSAKEEKPATATAAHSPVVEKANAPAPDPEAERNQIKEELTSTATALSTYQPNAADPMIELRYFISVSDIASNASTSPIADDKIKKQSQDLLKKLSAAQTKAFPKIRKAYGENARKKVWEHDIDVKIGGSGNSTITFIGGTFAANKNIGEFQQTISSILSAFRFKQANYKWYSGDDEYTYYKIDSKKDSEPVESNDLP